MVTFGQDLTDRIIAHITCNGTTSNSIIRRAYRLGASVGRLGLCLWLHMHADATGRSRTKIVVSSCFLTFVGRGRFWSIAASGRLFGGGGRSAFVTNEIKLEYVEVAEAVGIDIGKSGTDHGARSDRRRRGVGPPRGVHKITKDIEIHDESLLQIIGVRARMKGEML